MQSPQAEIYNIESRIERTKIHNQNTETFGVRPVSSNTRRNQSQAENNLRKGKNISERKMNQREKLIKACYGDNVKGKLILILLNL